ncbi:MAG: hypothetical protein M3Q08_15870 [Pseudomonadota bacterium]|nr:hypothetical protein [Pseudomonadota bacterium]
MRGCSRVIVGNRASGRHSARRPNLPFLLAPVAAQKQTTFTSYGKVPVHRQGELIQATSNPAPANGEMDTDALLAGLAKRLGKAA